MTLEELINYYEDLHEKALSDVNMPDKDRDTVYELINRINIYHHTAEYLKELKRRVEKDAERREAFDKFVKIYLEDRNT